MAASTSTDAPESAPKGSAYRWVVLVTLAFIYTFNYLDRQLMSILAEPIRKDMGLTDRQLGLLGGIYFASFYTVLGVAVGFFADKTSRIRILAVGSFLWSLFTSLCGFAGSYPTLMAARMGVGVGEAAGVPPSYSILSDYFPKTRRATAIGLYTLGIPSASPAARRSARRSPPPMAGGRRSRPSARRGSSPPSSCSSSCASRCAASPILQPRSPRARICRPRRSAAP